MNAAASLSLADLEAYDAHTPETGVERRFCCPRCGDGKKHNAAHRSLGVNSENGCWKCHRCGETGVLTEWRTRTAIDKPRNSSHRARAVSLRAFALPAPAPEPSAEGWDNTLLVGGKRFHKQPLDGLYSEAAASYLYGRGIAPEIAAAASVCFSPQWYGQPAVVFPLHDRQSRLVAAQGRMLRQDAQPKAMTAGPVSQGVFASAGAWEADALILTEAPLDALSLTACGCPALALCGKDLRPWLLTKLGCRRVYVALDADEAGDAASDLWLAELRRFGADVARLRPEGGKDWNDLLTSKGRFWLSEWLAEQLSPPVIEDDALFEEVCQVFGPVTVLED